jgi:hypothetical protein
MYPLSFLCMRTLFKICARHFLSEKREGKCVLGAAARTSFLAL